MWRKICVVTIAFLIVLSLGLTITNAVERHHLQVATTDLDAKLKSGHLIGASPARVISFLDRSHLSHGSYERVSHSSDGDRIIIVDNNESAFTITLRLGPITYVVKAILRFDTRDRLASYTVGADETGF